MAKTNKQPSEATYKVRRAGARALSAGVAAAGMYAAAKGFKLPIADDPALLGSTIAAGSTLASMAPDMIFNHNPADKMGRQFKGMGK